MLNQLFKPFSWPKLGRRRGGVTVPGSPPEVLELAFFGNEFRGVMSRACDAEYMWSLISTPIDGAVVDAAALAASPQQRFAAVEGQNTASLTAEPTVGGMHYLHMIGKDTVTGARSALSMPSLYRVPSATIIPFARKSHSQAGTTSPFNVDLSSLAMQAGDECLVGINIASTGGHVQAVVNSAGWTVVDYIGQTSALYCSGLLVVRKRMGAVPDTSIQINGTGSASNTAAVSVQVLRNVDPTAPLDVAPLKASASGIGRPNLPAISPANIGSVVVAFGGAASAAGTSGFTSPDLANFISIGVNGSAADAACGSGTFAWGGSGPIDPGEWGLGGGINANNCWTGIIIAARAVV